MMWSAWQGDFRNDALRPDQNHQVVESQATQACAKIGARLPSAEDYKRLCSYLNLEIYNFLTQPARDDLHAIFKDMRGHWFWSSSVDPESALGAYEFDGNSGGVLGPKDYIYTYVSRHLVGSVRCVK
jgi:hypothetical protein